MKALFVGPPLEEGPLPALFYFALSAEDSLERDPFNQPVAHLKTFPLRIFSMTLPAHENGFPPEKAMDVWKERMEKGEEVVPPFIQTVKEEIAELKPYLTKCAVAGLSRGAFIACHVAAACPEFETILGFAPLTRLDYASHLNVETLAPSLYDKTIRFYIGNHDTRVGTAHAFSFIEKLAKKAHAHRIRNSPIELIIGPSIGHQGHGTSPEIFKDGAEWIKARLGV